MSAAAKDPYAILGVARGATADEIKAAYRRLAKQHHPDRNPGDKGAERKFKEIQAAYEILGDEEKRAQFDRYGAGGPMPDFQSWGAQPPHDGAHVHVGDFGDLSDIFQQFFSGRAAGGARTRRRGAASAGRSEPSADLEHAILLTFEEAARGVHKEIVLTGGTGQETLAVRIPAGIADGQKIRVRGRGHPSRGGRGDLLLQCNIAPHSWFRRDGLDVLLDVPLSIAEAAGGAQVELPTLDGRTLVTIPPGTSSGAKLRLRGRGIRDERTGRTGDFYAVTRVVVPRELSAAARALLDQLDRELRQRPRVGPPWEG